MAANFEDDDPPILGSRSSGPLAPVPDDPLLHEFLREMLRSCPGHFAGAQPGPASSPSAPGDLSYRKNQRYRPVTDGGNPSINTPLPREGAGFKSYKTVETQYGYASTVEFIENVGAAWAELHPKPRLLIGDLAVRGGGLTPKSWGHPEKGYHLSHGSGLDFDVQIIRTDDIEKPREVSIADHLRYDRPRTQELINLIVDQAQLRFDCIITADKMLKAPRKVFDAGHVFHVHFRLKA
jgi:hypothetical protein